MFLIDALFRMDGTISTSSYWFANLLLLAAALVLLTVFTKGDCWVERLTPDQNRRLAVAISASSVLLTYPTAAVVVKRLLTIGYSPWWALVMIVPIIVQPITQWLGWNGSFIRPSKLGYAISLTFTVPMIILGLIG